MLLTTGSLRDAGQYGRYWSSTVFVLAVLAYYPEFDNTNFAPAGTTDRSYGFTVRSRKD